MTKNQLWDAYCAKNTAFAGNGNITLSAAGLKKLFDQTWEKAEEHGRTMAKNEQLIRDMMGLRNSEKFWL